MSVAFDGQIAKRSVEESSNNGVILCRKQALYVLWHLYWHLWYGHWLWDQHKTV